MADNSLKSWEDDPSLYLFTSLTAGSSHIITATSRIETMLKNARIPFTYIDTATNESAKRLFQRRARGKKLPLLVKDGFVIADLEEVEEWNEFGELRDNIGDVPTTATSITTTPAKMGPPSQPISAQGTPSKAPVTAAAAAAAAVVPPPVASAQKENTPISPPGAASQNPLMKQLAAESAAAARARKEGPPVPLGLRDIASKTSSADVETPVSPASVPLPKSPVYGDAARPTSLDSAVAASPTSPTATPAVGRRRSSSGSAHQYVPEHFEPPPAVHRGSSVSVASEEEVRRIEQACAIQEVDEETVEEVGHGAGVELPKATAGLGDESGRDGREKKDAVDAQAEKEDEDEEEEEDEDDKDDDEEEDDQENEEEDDQENEEEDDKGEDEEEEEKQKEHEQPHEVEQGKPQGPDDTKKASVSTTKEALSNTILSSKQEPSQQPHEDGNDEEEPHEPEDVKGDPVSLAKAALQKLSLSSSEEPSKEQHQHQHETQHDAGKAESSVES